MATPNTQSRWEVSLLPISQHGPLSDGGRDGERMPVAQYLTTMFHPDCDYVDGHVEERNLGEWDHARLQGRLLFLMMSHEADWKIRAVPECRLQVNSERYRVPDLMILDANQRVERIVREAPLLCIEVLSPEDTWKRLREKVQDYVELGVKHIWVFDPSTREAYRCDAGGVYQIRTEELTIPDSEIRVSLCEIFADLATS